MFDFSDITRKSEGPFPIGDKQYILYQANGEAAVAFRNASAATATYAGVGDRIGIQSIRNIADTELLLVQMCLFECYKQGNEDKTRPVLMSTVKQWPPHVIGQLFDWIKENTPGLIGQETEESLAKQRDNLDRRLAKMRGVEEDDLPNSSLATVNGSASVAK